MQLLQALVLSAMAVASASAQHTSPELFQLPRCEITQLSAIVESADGQECKRVSSLMIMAPAPASESGRQRGCQSDACRRMLQQFKAQFPTECTIPMYRMNGLYRLHADLLASISDCPQTPTTTAPPASTAPPATSAPPTTSAPATKQPAPAPTTTSPSPAPTVTTQAPSPTTTTAVAPQPSQNASGSNSIEAGEVSSKAGSGAPIETPTEIKRDNATPKPVVPQPTKASAATHMVQPVAALAGAVAVAMAWLL
ncbi:hypothetical protein PINS_up009384 [Pythium insidiosum]|nr:hypothetical protein PINS_up009384 [Pythium insidiosum]